MIIIYTELLPDEVRKDIPSLRATEHDPDPLAVVKFFAPWSAWTWYVFEFDGKDTFFGFVEGYYPELGSFTLSELADIRGPGGLSVERDEGFHPTRFSGIKKALKEYASNAESYDL